MTTKNRQTILNILSETNGELFMQIVWRSGVSVRYTKNALQYLIETGLAVSDQYRTYYLTAKGAELRKIINDKYPPEKRFINQCNYQHSERNIARVTTHEVKHSEDWRAYDFLIL